MKKRNERRYPDILTALVVMISYVLVYYTAIKIHYLDNDLNTKIERIEHILEKVKWVQ